MRKPSSMVGDAEGVCGEMFTANPRPRGAVVRPARRSAAHGSTRTPARKPAATLWWLDSGASPARLRWAVVDLMREVKHERRGWGRRRGGAGRREERPELGEEVLRWREPAVVEHGRADLNQGWDRIFRVSVGTATTRFYSRRERCRPSDRHLMACGAP